MNSGSARDPRILFHPFTLQDMLRAYAHGFRTDDIDARVDLLNTPGHEIEKRPRGLELDREMDSRGYIETFLVRTMPEDSSAQFAAGHYSLTMMDLVAAT